MAQAVTTWILKLKDQITSPLKGIDGQAKHPAIDVLAIAESARQLQQEFNKAIAPGIKFEDSLADVEAITGVTGDALESLGLKARKSAKHFGGEASGSLDNYKIILSKLGPGIAESEQALDSMNRHALTLSKSMNNDVNRAIGALTTSMLQFQTDLSDPIAAAAEMDRMMNIMAAGAQYGSAEIPAVAKAIEVSGVAASQAKVSYAEANAAIQELARGGKEGAEGGIALRNVLGKMAGADVIPKDALKKLRRYGVDMKVVSDTSLPLTTRLREIGKAQADATVFAQVFGVENAAAASILIRSADAQDELAGKIENTDTAYQMAAVKMDTYSEKMKRYKAWINDLKISFFNVTKEIAPFINASLQGVQTLSYLKNASEGVSMIMNTKLGTGLQFVASGFKKGMFAAFGFSKSLRLSGVNALKASGNFVITALTGIGSFITAIISATAAQWGLNIAMNANPIGLIVLGIAAVIGAIILVVKYWDKIKAAIAKFTKWIIKNNPFNFIVNLIDKVFPGFKAKVTALQQYIKGLLLAFWEKIKKIWNGIKKFFGFGSDEKTEIDVSGEVKVTKDDKKTNETKEKTTDPKKKGLGLFDTASGSSGSAYTDPGSSGETKSSKILKMTLNIENHFNLAGDKLRNNIEDIADQVVGSINDRLRDTLIALD